MGASTGFKCCAAGTKTDPKRLIVVRISRGTSEAAMLLMYLPLVIYSASMQMFLDGLQSPRVPESRKRELDSRDDR
jgi:hypothetical protein